MTRTVGIYLFDDVEVLDFAGPFEVFSTASRMKLRSEPAAPPPFEVFTVASGLTTIHARGGLAVQPAYSIANHPPIDVLVVPGGVVSAEVQRAKVIAWITRVAGGATLTASVCTGAFLLGQAGLLHGKIATTHWENIADLHTAFPNVTVQANTRWVDQGTVVTSAGISAGIDMSLHLVARLENLALAISTARQMEFDWQQAS